MPFHTLVWKENATAKDEFELGTEPAVVKLRQKGSETFVILESFHYVASDEDPDPGKTYVVPGADAPGPWKDAATIVRGGREIVIPPNAKCGETDLASVPWFMWWLIATYGNHTKATLLHDALVVDEKNGEQKPVPRTAADRLLLTALREDGQQAGVFRHWLMWAAVSTFGTLGRARGVLFAAHVLAFWVALAAAFFIAWGATIWELGPTLWPDDVDPVPFVPGWVWNVVAIVAVQIAAVGLFLLFLGGAWRAGRPRRAGWLLPIVALAVVVVVLAAFEWPWSPAREWSPVNLLAAAFVLLLTGLLWGAAVDRSLWGWLWPTALIGLPIALLPIGLILLAVLLVRLIDEGAARVRGWQRDEETGERIGYDPPKAKPTHFPL